MAPTQTLTKGDSVGAVAIPHGTENGYRNHKCRCANCTEAHRIEGRRYVAANRERTRERMLASYHRRKAADPEKMLAAQRAYSKTPKAMLANRLKAHRRRGIKYDTDAREYVTMILNDPCAYCGAPATEIDHIDPVNGGGTGEWTNLTPSCRSCNASKHDKPLLRFLSREVGTLPPASLLFTKG